MARFDGFRAEGKRKKGIPPRGQPLANRTEGCWKSPRGFFFQYTKIYFIFIIPVTNNSEGALVGRRERDDTWHHPVLE